MPGCECVSKAHAKNPEGRPCHAVGDGRRCREEATTEVEAEVKSMVLGWDQVRRRVTRRVRLGMCTPCAEWSVARGKATVAS